MDKKPTAKRLYGPFGTDGNGAIIEIHPITDADDYTTKNMRVEAPTDWMAYTNDGCDGPVKSMRKSHTRTLLFIPRGIV